jgi:ferredoxin-NADP reductase
VNLAIRNTILRVHRWTGLTVGLVAVYLAITGLAMVFRPQLQPIGERALRDVPSCSARLPLDELVARARDFHREGAVAQIETLEGGFGATIVRFADGEGIYLNSCSGAVIGHKERWAGFFDTAEQLHRLLFIGNADATELVLGSVSLVVALLLVAGGLAMLWPSSLKALASVARFRFDLLGRAFDVNLHRTVGIYAAAILLLSTLTSLTFTFEWARHAIFAATGSAVPSKKPTVEAAASAAMLPAETFMARTLKVVPDAREIQILFPRKKGDAVEVQVLGRDAPHANARTYVYMDPFIGDIVRFEPYAAASPGTKVYRWLGALHKGEVGGLAMQLVLFAGILGVPVLGFTGARSYLRRRLARPPDDARLAVRVARISEETPETRVFELEPIASALPAFTPGAHVDVHVDEGVVRQYSLCNGPEDRGRYIIAVKREADSRGGSRSMHERVAPGDTLAIGAPRNHFPIDPSATHHLLVAGGIGITPLLAMARHLQSAHGSFSLQYFTRSIEMTAFHGFLSRPEFRGKVAFHYAIDPEALHPYLHKLLWIRPPGTHLYVCGPRPFMDLVEEIAASNWPPTAIHSEYFNANPMAFAGPREPFEVTLALSGGTYPVPADRTIVEALAERGIEIPTSCLQGVCGTCVTGVLDGVPDHRDAFLGEAERRAGDKIMPCVSRCKGRALVLDL